MLPGDSINVPFDITIFPSSGGGCITFTATLFVDSILLTTHQMCVGVVAPSLTLGSHSLPEITCDGGDLSPDTFEVTVMARNTGACAIFSGNVALSNLNSPGGTGQVLSGSPFALGMLEPGDSTAAVFAVRVIPSYQGGCVRFRAQLRHGTQNVTSRDICALLPARSATILDVSAPEITCVDNLLTPTSFEISVTAANSSNCEFGGLSIRLRDGTGVGNGQVISPENVALPVIEPNGTATALFGVQIDSASLGGVCTFRAELRFGNQALATHDVSISVPVCDCNYVNGVTLDFVGILHACGCMQLCDTIPIAVSLCREGGVPNRPPGFSLTPASCLEGCTPGSAVLTSESWERVGSCWHNEISMVTPGCIRLCGDVPFGVAFGSFSALSSYRAVELAWNTLSESDLDHFELARDGLLFAQIPAVNSLVGAEYEWTDTGVPPGRLYEYELAVVDAAGGREVLATAGAMPLSQSPFVEQYRLLPGFPNPFNAQTNIAFELPVADHVHIQVFDVVGRKIRELTNGWYSAGRHTLSFDASRLPSGLYFCYMQTPVFEAKQKLLLLK